MQDDRGVTIAGPRWSEQAWMAQGACRGLSQLFFGAHREREESRLAREARARAVCARCVVLAECRTYARRAGELGFWGGENDEERAAARRRPAPPVRSVRPPAA